MLVILFFIFVNCVNQSICSDDIYNNSDLVTYSNEAFLQHLLSRACAQCKVIYHILEHTPITMRD